MFDLTANTTAGRLDKIETLIRSASMLHDATMPTQISLTIGQLDPGPQERLRIRAANNGRSVGAEARAILEEALTFDEPEMEMETAGGLVQAIRRRFEPLGGVDLELPSRMARSEPISGIDQASI